MPAVVYRNSLFRIGRLVTRDEKHGEHKTKTLPRFQSEASFLKQVKPAERSYNGEQLRRVKPLLRFIMMAQWENECLSVCPPHGPGSTPGRGGVFQGISSWLITHIWRGDGRICGIRSNTARFWFRYDSYAEEWQPCFLTFLFVTFVTLFFADHRL